MAFEDIQNVDQPLQQESQLQDENQIQQDTDANLPVIDLDAAEQQDPPTKSQQLYRNLLNIKNQDGSSKYTKDVLGSEDEFSTALSDSAKADNIYSKLVSDGFTVEDIGDKNEFLNTFVVKKKDGGLPSPTGAQVDANGLPIAPLKSASALADQKEELPPQEEEDPNDFIAKARKASKLRTTATSVSVSGGTGGAAVSSITDPNIVNQANAIDEEVKAAGYNPDKLNKDMDGINPVYFQNEDYTNKRLLDLYKNNPQRYERNIASAKFGSSIFNSINSNQNLSPEEKSRLKGIVLQSSKNVYDPKLGLEDVRGNIQSIVNVTKNVSGDKSDEVLSNIYTAYAPLYAAKPINTDDPLRTKLSDNQIRAYKLLQDTNPKEALTYQILLQDPNLVGKDYPSQLSYQEKGKRLEEIGIGMTKNWALENMNVTSKEYKELSDKYTNAQSENKDISSQYNENTSKIEALNSRATELKGKIEESLGKYKGQYIDEYNKVVNEANALSQENERLSQPKTITKEEIDRLSQLDQSLTPYRAAYNAASEAENSYNKRFPLAIEKDANHYIQHFIGQEHGYFAQAGAMLGKAWSDAGQSINEIFTTPTLTEEENVVKQNRLFGIESSFNREFYRVPQTEEKPKLDPFVQEAMDKIVNDNTLTYAQKKQKGIDLLKGEPISEWQKTSLGELDSNSTPTSALYGITDMIMGLVPFLTTEAVTGGGATPLIASRFARSFFAGGLTMFHQNYLQSAAEGSKNPYSDAAISTAILSAAMAVGDLPGKIRASINAKTPIGKLLSSLTDDEIKAVIRKGSESAAYKALQATLNIGANIAKRSLTSVSEAAGFTASMTGGEALKDYTIYNKLKPADEYAKDFIVQTLKFAPLNFIMGTVGAGVSRAVESNNFGKSVFSDFKKIVESPNDNLTKDALFQSASNPIEILTKIRDGVSDGTISATEAMQMSNNVNRANLILQSTPMLDAKGNKLDLQGQRDILFYKLQLKEAENLLTQDIPRQLASDLGERIVKINKQIDNIWGGTLLEKAPITIQPSRKLTREGNTLINDAVESGQISAEEVPDRKTKIELIKNIADQAKDPAQAAEVRKKYGDDLVDHALEQHPIESEEVKPVADTEILSTFGKASAFIPSTDLESAQATITKVNNAENINEGEIKATENILYTALDKHPEAAHLIEPLITKLQDHEFTTKTKTVETTERVPVEGTFAAKGKIETKPAFEHTTGSEATVTLADGTVHSGTLEVENGNYVIKSEGKESVIIGEKQITDRDLKLPSEERVPQPFKMDKDGNLESVSLETRDGHVVEVKGDKALDIAIKLQAEAVGEIPDAAFEKVYQDVVKTNNIEVPVEKPVKVEKETEATKEAPKKEEKKTEPTTKRKTAAEKIKERRERKKKETKAEMPPAGRPQVDLPPQVHTAESIDLVDTTGYDKTQKKLIKDAKKVGEAIKDIVKEITGRESKIVIHSNDASFIKAAEKASGEEQSQLRGKGFYFSGDGTIHINMTRASKETMKHEGFHPLLDFVASHSPETLSKLFKQLESIPGVEKLLQDVKDTYKGESETTIQKEAITDFIAKVADGSIVINPSNFQKVKNLVVKLLNKLGLGLEEAEIMNIKGVKELQDLAQLVTEKFTKGEKIAVKDIETYIKNAEELNSSEGIDNEFTLKDVKGESKRGIQLSKIEDDTLKSVKTSIIDYKSIPNLQISRTLFYDNTRVGELDIKNRLTGYTPKVDGKGGFFYSYMPEALKNKAVLAFTSANQAIQTLKRQMLYPESAQAISSQNFQTSHLGNKSTLKALFGEKGSNELGIFQESVKNNPKGEKELLNALIESTINVSKQKVQSGVNAGTPTGASLEIKKMIDRNGGNLKGIKSLNDFRDKILTFEGGDSFGARNVLFTEVLQEKSTKVTKSTRDSHQIIHYKYGIPTISEIAEGNNQKQLNNAQTGDVIKLVKPYSEPIIYTTVPSIFKQYSENPTREMIDNGIKIKLLPESLNHESYPFVLRGENVGILDNYIAAPQIYQEHEKIKNVPKKQSFYNVGRMTAEALPGSFPSEPISEGVPQFSKEKSLPSQSKLEQDAESRKATEAGEAKINSEKVRYNGTDVIGSRERTESEQTASRNEAKEKIKNPETNASLKSANSYNKEAGLPEVTQHKYKPSDEAQQTQVAKLYPKLQDVNSPTYKETEVEKRIFSEYKAKYPKIIDQYNVENYKDLVTKAYDQLIEETQAQYNRLPVKVSFHENGEGNYENNFEMLDDVHNFNHLWVYKGGDDHTALGSKTIDKDGLTANDKFRAVHDYYGHSVEGYQFGKDGEENAWIEHSKMFSPLAQWALSSETRGQNSWVNYSGVNDVVLQEIKTGSALKKEGKKTGNQEMIDEGEKLLSTVYDKFTFAEQKAMLLPPQYTDVSKFHDKVIKEVPENLLTYDKANKSRIPSKIGIGKEPVKAEPIKGAGAEKISTGGDVQAPGDVGKGKGDIQLSKEKEVDDLNEMKDILREYTNQGYSLSDVKEIMKDEFGEDYAGEEPTIEQAYNELTTTSIKNKTTARERAERGLDPVVVEAKRSFGEVWDNANKMIDDGEVTPSVLASVIANKPRALSAEESAILLKDRMDISQEYGMKTEQLLEAQDKGNDIEAGILQSQLAVLEERMDINDQAARKSGYELGLGLAARRMLIAKDYSLATQLQRLKAANGGEDVSQEYRGKLKDLINQLDEANNKVYELEKRNLANQVQKGIANTKKVSKSSDDVKKERQSIKEKIADKWGKIVAAVKGKEGEVLYSKAPALVPVTPEKQAKLEAITKDINDLVKSHAESGNTDLKKIIEDIHADISSVIPELTKQDIEDVVTGRYKKEIVKVALTPEQIKVQADVQRVKTQIDLLKNELELKQRSKGALAMDYLQGWHRFSILSGIPSLGKIAVAGSMRGITSRVEGLVGHALSYIPGIHQIAKGAVREGRFSPAAEAKAFTTWFDKMTREDFRRVRKTGKSELDILYGSKGDMPEKFPAWMEFFGRMHGAMKLFPKRSEFFRSLEMRTEDAIKKGKDPHDLTVQAELTAAAYNDALRAVFMQDNYITDAYKAAVNNLQNSDIQGAKQTATALKFIFPIIKVPTNYVAEESSYMLGGLKALYALRKGVSKMTPEQKDYFMRAMKKQAVGIGFMMLGYLNPQALGGYYTGKRKEGELEAGDIELFGTKLPHWMSHSPLLEMLQVGATLRRASDKEVLKGNEPSKTKGIPDVFKGQIKQIPFFGGGGRIEEAFKGGDNFWDGVNDYLSGTVQSITEPQILQNISKWTDTEEGKVIKRLPSGFTEKMMEGTPLRSRLEKEKELFTPDEKEEGILKLLQDKGVELPFIKPRKKIKVIQDESHPDGVMSSEEYDMYAEKLNKKVKKKVKETLSDYYEIKEGNKYTYKSGKNLEGKDLEDKVNKAEGQASRDVLEEMNLLPKEKRTVTKLD